MSDSIRSTTTRRGFVYSYHYNPSTSGKPTILFLHGFPSTHKDWESQITYLSGKGYGVIAPDLLGYGGTSAPEDFNQYKMVDMAEDIIDILSDLKIDKVIGVAHDWGCILLGRLLNNHIDHFLGSAFLAVGYAPPSPNFNYKDELTKLNKLIGYDVFGYWQFFSEDDAPALTEKNIDSFYSILFPNDPSIWKTDMAPLGKVREWIEQNKQSPRADYWTAERREEHKKALLKQGLRGPYNWYKTAVAGVNNEGDAAVLQDNHQINIPVFLGAALKDYICLPSFAKVATAKFCPNLVTRDFDTSHWIMLEASDELNEALDEFFGTF